MKFTTTHVFIVLIIIVVGGLVAARYYKSPEPAGALDGFAQCLADSGIKFYGAFWCPHCQAQKKLFGNSVKLLPYVECSTADGQGQLPVCTDAGIKSYPTWIKSDGTVLAGEQTLQGLADATSCKLP